MSTHCRTGSCGSTSSTRQAARSAIRNLGVEAGQVAAVALAWVPLRWWARPPWHPASARACAAAILVVAFWWAVERALG